MVEEDPPRIVQALEFSPNFDMKRFDADMAYLRAKLNARKEDLFKRRTLKKHTYIKDLQSNADKMTLSLIHQKVEGLIEIML